MKIKTMVSQFIVAALFLVAITAFAQEIPAPGTTIDKSNYKKYQHLFPPELGPGFEDGFGGVIGPIHMNVVATKKFAGQPKVFLDFSAKNKGRYSLTADGNITPAYSGKDGLPFPDLRRDDKDFIQKFMWNFQYKYDHDDMFNESLSYTKRKGEPAILNGGFSYGATFEGRMVASPKPHLENPLGLKKTMLVHMLRPESIRNTMTMMYRYADSEKRDDTYIYLPSMRRVLRAESSTRSSPIQGTIMSLDDTEGFDGRTPEFTYTLVEEKKALAIADGTKMTADAAKKWKQGELPWVYDDYMLRDVYVIDIKPKDARYPQSRKRIYVDKESYHPYHIVVWDRAGKPWKMWIYGSTLFPVPVGELSQKFTSFSGIDVQYGMANTVAQGIKCDTNKYTYSDFTPAALLKRAR